MQQHPVGWLELFAGPHNTEYKYTINGVDYFSTDIKGTPIILKPLMETPSIGSCCSGTLTIVVRKKPGISIPKSAGVLAHCRLASKDGTTVTDWVQQGEYRIAQRMETGDLVRLTCRDLMLLASQSYLEHTTFKEWPVAMTAVVTEIAAIMGVEIDPRTAIRTGGAYMVARPNEDTLMSEVLSGIAAAHCGNWIMTETAALRLVTLSSTGTPAQEIGSGYKSYTPLSLTQHISRITLEDSAGNRFSAGDDTGTELAAVCDYVTQQTLNDLLDGAEVRGCTLYKAPGTVSGTTFTTDTGTVENGTWTLPSKSIDIAFTPYELLGAYIDPCLELGDTVSITHKGAEIPLILAAMSIRCNQSFNADVSFRIENVDEDEFPYTDLDRLEASRYVSTAKSYYGNKLNRTDGFISERVTGDGSIVARLKANADIFSMQQYVDGGWADRIYFDAAAGKYRISGEVEIEGSVTFKDLESPQEQTFIHGGNIITGSLSANTITTGILKSKDGNIVFNLDTGELKVGSDDMEAALAKIDNAATLLASSQLFVKEAGATEYTPAEITLTAETSGALKNYKWYKDGVEIAGATTATLTVTANDVTGDAATYKMVASDDLGNEYADCISIAKIADGEKGEQGDPGKDGADGADGADGEKGEKGDPGEPGKDGADGAPGEPGKDGADGADGAPGKDGADGTDGYTVILGDEYIEIPVSIDRKPKTTQTFDCKVDLYKGVTALTPTTGTPGAGTYKVAVEGSYTGITVSRPSAGTIRLAVSTATAIADFAKIKLNVTTGSPAITLTAYIVVLANMNTIVVTHDSSITTMNNAINMRVTETTYHTQVPTYSTTDPSTNWTSTQKTANTGYLWFDASTSTLKKWTGSAWSTSTSYDTWAEYAEASMDMSATKISWIVKSGTTASNFTMTDRAISLVTGTLTLTATSSSDGTSSTLTLKSGSTTLSSSKITITGFVTFNALETADGTTTINGGNITTGTIKGVEFITEKLIYNDGTYQVYRSVTIDEGRIEWSAPFYQNWTLQSLDVMGGIYADVDADLITYWLEFRSEENYGIHIESGAEIRMAVPIYQSIYILSNGQGSIFLGDQSSDSITIGGSSIRLNINGNYGSYGQVLMSNGYSSMYWGDIYGICDFLVSGTLSTVGQSWEISTEYSAYLVIGKVTSGGSCTSVLIPRDMVYWGEAWQITDETHYLSFNISSTAITLKAKSNSGGYIMGVWGIK